MSYTMLTPVHFLSGSTNKDANLTRPTVLKLAYKGVSEESCQSDRFVPCPSGTGNNIPPEDNLKWMGAMALMELAKTEGEYGTATAVTPLNLSQPRYTQL
jgi:hypothetical protein